MTTEIQERIEEELQIKRPNYWRVILHNDNVTTMEFVIFLLKQVFHKTTQEATEIMLIIHEKGQAITGIFTHEIAENKMNLCISAARKQGFPLTASIEEEK